MEKANEIKIHYTTERYNKIFVHGDSKQDMDMLRIGTDSYYKWKRMKSFQD